MTAAIHRYHLNRFAVQCVFHTPTSSNVNEQCYIVVWLNRETAEYHEVILPFCCSNFFVSSEARRGNQF